MTEKRSADVAPAPKRARLGALLEDHLALLAKTEVLSDCPSSPFIATHHGTFHADEVMACVMLKLLPQYARLPICRTRDTKVIDKAEIVVDVGATYEPEKHRYDHHQSSFTTTYNEGYAGIKLSSAGLVFKHFGAKVVECVSGVTDPEAVDKLVQKVYGSLILE